MATVTAGTIAIGGFTRSVFPILATSIIADLGTTPGAFGIAISAKTGATVVLIPFAGAIVDKWGARRILVIRAICIAGAIWLAASARSYVHFLLAMALIGVGLSTGNSATNKVIAQTIFGRATRGVVTGVKHAGAQGGMLVAALAIPILHQMFGWRLALALGVAMAIASGSLTFFLPPPTNIARVEVSEEPSSDYKGTVFWVALVGLGIGIASSTIISFLPLYAENVLAMTKVEASLIIAVMATVGGLARVAWGRAAGSSLRFVTLTLFISISGSLASLLVAAAVLGGPLLLWIGALLAAVSLEAWNTVGSVGIMEATPTAIVGRATGLISFGFVIGATLGPAVSGLLLDATDSFTSAWLVSAAAPLIVGFTFARRGGALVETNTGDE